MNAFTINYDSWYLDFFAYSKFLGQINLDSLTDYIFTENTGIVFTNLEEIQSAYKNYIVNEKWHEQTLKKAFGISEYHIILGVQQLFREAKEIGRRNKFKWTTVPVFVSSHDYKNLTYCVTRT